MSVIILIPKFQRIEKIVKTTVNDKPQTISVTLTAVECSMHIEGDFINDIVRKEVHKDRKMRGRLDENCELVIEAAITSQYDVPAGMRSRPKYTRERRRQSRDLHQEMKMLRKELKRLRKIRFQRGLRRYWQLRGSAGAGGGRAGGGRGRAAARRRQLYNQRTGRALFVTTLNNVF